MPTQKTTQEVTRQVIEYDRGMRDFDVDTATWLLAINDHLFKVEIVDRRAKPIELLRLIRYISAIADGEDPPTN